MNNSSIYKRDFRDPRRSENLCSFLFNRESTSGDDSQEIKQQINSINDPRLKHENGNIVDRIKSTSAITARCWDNKSLSRTQSMTFDKLGRGCKRHEESAKVKKLRIVILCLESAQKSSFLVTSCNKALPITFFPHIKLIIFFFCIFSANPITSKMTTVSSTKSQIFRPTSIALCRGNISQKAESLRQNIAIISTESAKSSLNTEFMTIRNAGKTEANASIP